MHPEEDLLHSALQAFTERTGYRLKKRLQLAGAKLPDEADAALSLTANKQSYDFLVTVKNHLNRQTLGAALQQLRALPGKAMLVADYVNPEIAEDLKKLHIPFIDTAGNAFINEPPFFIYVTGNRPKSVPKNTAGKTYHPAGLKVLFVLLCEPTLINKPFREIATSAGVALGTVGKVMEDLKMRGHLQVAGGERVLTGKKKLLREWVMLYPLVLRPKLFIGTYQAADAAWWKKKVFHGSQFFGGEPAADILTGYLKPEVVTVYTYDKPAKFLAKNKLREDPAGAVEIVKAFWKVDLNDTDRNTVPPLLVYTDLLVTGDPRNVETAEKVYDQELAERFTED